MVVVVVVVAAAAVVVKCCHLSEMQSESGCRPWRVPSVTAAGVRASGQSAAAAAAAAAASAAAAAAAIAAAAASLLRRRFDRRRCAFAPLCSGGSGLGAWPAGASRVVEEQKASFS